MYSGVQRGGRPTDVSVNRPHLQLTKSGPRKARGHAERATTNGLVNLSLAFRRAAYGCCHSLLGTRARCRGLSTRPGCGHAVGRTHVGRKIHWKTPGSMRVVAFISAVLLVAFGMIVSIRSGILFPDWQPISRTLIWFVVAYCILGTLANAATPSRWERLGWLPVVLGMLISSLVVGIS